MQRFIGLDVHKASTTFAVLDPQGQVLERGTFPSTPGALGAFAKTLTRDDQVVLEATTNTWAFYDQLVAHAGTVAIANPLKVRLIAEATLKTDGVDAVTLAQLLRTGYLPPVWVPDATTRRWRSLVAHREQLVKQRTSLKNRIHAILHRHLIEVPSGCTDLFGKRGRQWLATVALPEADRAQLDSALRLLDAVTAETTAWDTRLAREVHGRPDFAKLLAVPGLELATAMTLVAAIGDVTRFAAPKKLVGYLGLCPRVRQTSTHCYMGSITKAGSASARWMAIQAAHALVRVPSPLQQWFFQLKKRIGSNKAIVAVARKLVILVWHLLTREAGYRHPRPSLHQAKLARVRILATGERLRGGVPKGYRWPAAVVAARTAKRWGVSPRLLRPAPVGVS